MTRIAAKWERAKNRGAERTSILVEGVGRDCPAGHEARIDMGFAQMADGTFCGAMRWRPAENVAPLQLVIQAPSAAEIHAEFAAKLATFVELIRVYTMRNWRDDSTHGPRPTPRGYRDAAGGPLHPIE